MRKAERSVSKQSPLKPRLHSQPGNLAHNCKMAYLSTDLSQLNLIPRVLSLPREPWERGWKVPWLGLVTWQCMPTQAAQRVGPRLNFVITV